MYGLQNDLAAAITMHDIKIIPTDGSYRKEFYNL